MYSKAIVTLFKKIHSISDNYKSVFLCRVIIHFQKYPFIDILPEPLNKWTNLEGNDMLGLIYSDPERWGLAQVLNRFTYFEYFSCKNHMHIAY